MGEIPFFFFRLPFLNLSLQGKVINVPGID
jgi:hypothetical protein